MFSWKPIYIELGQKLLAYRDKQSELLGWLRQMKAAGLPVVGLNDQNPKDTTIDLAEIDPFTFFANFNRGIKYEHRFAILQILKDRMGLSAEVPEDFDGVPVAPLLKAWYFPYAFIRQLGSIPLLWDLAEDIVQREPSEVRAQVFEKCLQIKQVGVAKLTMGMFWLRPDRYLALDQVNRVYLEERHGFEEKDLKAKTLQSYLDLLKAVTERAGSDLPAISYQAYSQALMVDLDPAELDQGLRRYLERLAQDGGYGSIRDLVDRINEPESSGETEITNRTIHQKELQQALRRGDVTAQEIAAITKHLWALGGRQDSIRREAFLKSDQAMADMRALLDESAGVPVAVRIDDFIDAAGNHGYGPEDGDDPSLVAQFASVLLSSQFPDRYVDFRANRWNRLYKGLTDSNTTLLRGEHYGHMLARAGSFAALIAKTPTFQEFFGKSDELWSVAGLAWALKKGGPRTKRYWAGGFLFGGTDSRLSEFLDGGYWRHGYARDSTEPAAKRVWALFDQIQEGDEFAIKGFGGTNDLKVKFVGRVTEILPKKGRVNLEKLDRPLYEGKGPTGAGAGNWQLTLLEVNRKDVIDMVFKGTETPEKESTKVVEPLPAKNIILYGPPGTGKTYALRTEYMERFTERGAAKTQDQLADELVADLAWWEVSTMVMLDLKTAKVSDILAHPLMKARVRRSATKNERAAVWAHLQMHTDRDCPNVAYTKRYEPLLFSKSADSVWSIDDALARSEVPELAEALEKWRRYQPSAGDVVRRYEFVTFHQSYSYEEFVEGIKPTLDGAADGELSYEVKAGIFRQIASRAMADPGHDYAIFIDEINRGNIASILGELITLLEDDKRLGAKQELTARLPYSRQEFGVPPNLYVIGTMNTADRSVEALDAALRRRFHFVECAPKPELLADRQPVGLPVNLVAMLTTINGRLERLRDRDHCIGHSYFWELKEQAEPLVGLRQVFANKVMPLLREYFYGDPGKIARVLGPAFVRKQSAPMPFASGSDDTDDDEEREVYEFTDIESLGVEAFQAIYEKPNTGL
jgi:hypothetical protein